MQISLAVDFFAYLGFKTSAESAENSETLRLYLEDEKKQGRFLTYYIDSEPTIAMQRRNKFKDICTFV